MSTRGCRTHNMAGKYKKSPLMPYMTPCVASNPPTVLQKLAARSEVTITAAAIHIPGRRAWGQRWTMTATKGEEKYMMPVWVVPMAATPVGFELKSGFPR